MSADFIQAAAELDFFANKLKAILSVAGELRRIGSLQQAGNEAQARVDELRRTETELDASVAAKRTAAEGEHQQAVTDAAAIRSGAETEKAVILDRAKVEAQSIKDAATAEAGNIKNAAEAALASHTAGIVAATTELKTMNLLLAAKSKEIAVAQGQTQDATAALERVRSEHAQFLSKIGAR